tara:strand:+ start:58 stop:993 length:936 start_codon:yes stop_codon:yes gene_type:complete
MNIKKYTDPYFYIKTWWKYKISIIFLSLLVALFSVFYALSLDNKYTSTAYIKLVDSQETSSISNLAPQYSNLAGLAGIDLNIQNGNTAEEIIKKIYSREFLRHLLTFEDIKLNIVAAESFDFSLNKIIYDERLYDTKEMQWVREPDFDKNRGSEPSYVEVFDEFYISKISASKDKLSGLIFITFEHASPYFAQNFINLIIKELNETERSKDLEDYSKALQYLSEQQENYTNNQIKKTLSRLEEKYIELQVLAKSKTDYVVESIDSPFLPEEKSYPARAILCITISILGFIFILISVMFFEALRSFKKNRNA